jgi:predicted GNAT family acetyltransferase/uncharacterized Fe-S cluster protein YjdI
MDKEKKMEYTNGEITIVWQPNLCAHSGNCVKSLPEVYKPKERPWVQIENTKTSAIIKQMLTCPSGALSYYLNNDHFKDNTKDKRYEYDTPEGIAVLEYILVKDKIYLTHTEVPKVLNGKGIGSKLVRAALEDIKSRSLTLIPLCPFVALYLQRNPQYKTLVLPNITIGD